MTTLRRTAALLTSAAVLALPLASTAVSADAAPKPRSYKDCKALNKVYPHGVAKRKGVHDHTSAKPVTNFTVNAKVYALNDGKDRKVGERDLDRDNDLIACEKR